MRGRLRTIDRARRVTIVAIAIFIPAVLFVAYDPSIDPSHLAFVAALTILLIPTLWLGNARCPRCGHTFYGLDKVNPFRVTCLFCGISLKDQAKAPA